MRSAEDLLRQKTAETQERVPFSSLTDDEVYIHFCHGVLPLHLQLSAVSHAVELVKIVLPDFKSSNIDIYQGQDSGVSVLHQVLAIINILFDINFRLCVPRICLRFQYGW